MLRKNTKLKASIIAGLSVAGLTTAAFSQEATMTASLNLVGDVNVDVIQPMSLPDLLVRQSDFNEEHPQNLQQPLAP